MSLHVPVRGLRVALIVRESERRPGARRAWKVTKGGRRGGGEGREESGERKRGCVRAVCWLLFVDVSLVRW